MCMIRESNFFPHGGFGLNPFETLISENRRSIVHSDRKEPSELHDSTNRTGNRNEKIDIQ